LAFHKSRTRLVSRSEAMLGLGLGRGGLEEGDEMMRGLAEGVCALSCWGREGREGGRARDENLGLRKGDARLVLKGKVKLQV